MFRGFLEEIRQSQFRLELRKTIGEKDMNNASGLERALHQEAVIRIEEEEQKPRVASIRRDETEILIDSVNRLVQQMSVVNIKILRSVTVQETTATGVERDAMRIDIGVKIQEIEQEHPPQDQIRAKEKTIPRK